MGVATQIPAQEYLDTSYEPARRKPWGIHVYPEVRLKPGTGRYVAPDLETLQSELHTASGNPDVCDRVLRIPGTPIEVPLDSLDEE